MTAGNLVNRSDMTKKVLPRIALYGLLAAASAATVFSLNWHVWRGYTCKVQGEGITLYTDYDTRTAAQILGFSRAFQRFFSASVLPVPAGKLKIYLFKDQRQYYGYCRKVRALDPSPFGFYSRRHRLIAINGSMGFATVLHEMVHHFMHRGGYRLPGWLEEGLAAYFERGMGYFENEGDFLLLFGYLNPVKFQDVRSMACRDGLTFEAMKTSQHLAGTFFVFADRRKAMGPFLETYLDGGDLEASCRRAFGGDRERTEREWTDFVRSVVLGTDFEFWQQIGFFGSRQDFESWLERHGARWDEELEVYTTKSH